MHWNVALDALPGSARLVRVLDRWHNDCVLDFCLLKMCKITNCVCILEIGSLCVVLHANHEIFGLFNVHTSKK